MKKTSRWMDYLKLRASWGQNGNQDIPAFQYLSTISFSGSDYTFGPDKSVLVKGAYPDILANEDLTWETSEQLDLGIDARFLDNRLGLTFDYYVKTTKDWLVEAPILDSYGTGAPYINGGDVRNSGFELALSWNDEKGGLRYGVNWNMAYNKNKVTRIANSEGIITGQATSSATGQRKSTARRWAIPSVTSTATARQECSRPRRRLPPTRERSSTARAQAT